MGTKQRHSFFYRNSLSIILLILMFVFWAGQFYTGWLEHNEERMQDGLLPLTAGAYLTSGHFLQATFENWESEFLQMAVYVLLTISLRQEGSSESKKLDGKEEVDREPRPSPRAPGPVKKGGIWLKIYSSSLSIAFILLFLLSFLLHFIGSKKDHDLQQMVKGLPRESWSEYLAGSRFWFESFQNWQSEFLAVAAIVILSIWLRQKGSPESKPVDAPYDETGN